MLVDLSGFSPRQVYHAMFATIIPRPIAWVLSDSGNGSYNIAPFSFFNGICSDPPIIMLSVGPKADGSRKDTWVNIDERSDFVIHIVGRGLAAAMVASSTSLPHGESELIRLDIETTAVDGYRLPRLAGPRVAMCCEKYAIHEVRAAPQGLILGRVKGLWLDDDVAEDKCGRLIIDASKVDPVARLGDEDYALFAESTRIKRPT